MAESPERIEERIERLEKAVRTMAAWLAQTPGVWGVQDVRGIERILERAVPADEEQHG